MNRRPYSVRRGVCREELLVGAKDIQSQKIWVLWRVARVYGHGLALCYKNIKLVIGQDTDDTWHETLLQTVHTCIKREYNVQATRGTISGRSIISCQFRRHCTCHQDKLCPYNYER